MAKLSRFELAKKAFTVFGFLLIVWGFYRLMFRLPEQVEELIIKPIIWLGVVALMLRDEKRGWESVGWVGKNLFKNIYLGLGLGMVFAIEGVVANLVKYGHINFASVDIGQLSFFSAFAISLATSFSEETAFRGYIQQRLTEASKSRWFAIALSTLMFVAIHLPIWIFGYKYTVSEMVLQSLILGIFSIGNGALYAMTGSIVGPVITHAMWGWTVVLFR
jgi:uncharacterized protein